MKQVSFVKQFYAFFTFEVRSFFQKKSLILATLLLTTIALVFVQFGAMQYNENLKKKESFQQFEKSKVDRFINYTVYGGYGYRTIFLPAPISIFFTDSTIMPDMKAFVDSGERLNIYQPLTGQNIFKTKTTGFADFSGILLFFGSLLTILYIADAFKNKEYLKFLASFIKSEKMFFATLLSRTIIIGIVITGIFAASIVVIWLNLIPLPLNRYLFYFLLLLLLQLLFFSAISAVTANLKQKGVRFPIMITVWFMLLFGFPAIFSSIVQWQSSSIKSLYDLEIEKFNLVMDFEKEAIEKAGTFDYGKVPSDMDRKLIQSYQNTGLKKINLLENSMRDQMKKSIRFHHTLSILFPTSFYKSATNEISSTGLSNLVRFYKYVQNSKTNFFKFYMEKIYFSKEGDQPEKIESFIKGDENIMIGKSFLPHFFFLGISVTILFILILYFISMKLFKNNFLITCNNNKDISRLESKSVKLNIIHNDLNVIVCRGNFYLSRIYSIFCIQNDSNFVDSVGISFNFKTSDSLMELSGEKQQFIYLCHFQHWPSNVSCKHFFLFFNTLTDHKIDLEKIDSQFLDKNFKHFNGPDIERFYSCLLNLDAPGFFLLADIIRNFPIETVANLKQIMELSSKRGNTIIYLTENEDITLNQGDSHPIIYKSSKWGKFLEIHKDIHNYTVS